MTLVVKIDGVAIADDELLITGAPNSDLPGGVAGLPTAAWYGESLTGNLQIIDQDGELDLTGLHTLTVDEDDCAKPRIWGGWITGRNVGRGPYRDGVARVWSVDCIDINWAFSLETFRAESAHRPAENDITRAAFALASGPMQGTPVADNGRANFTDNPINFGDADYVGKFPIELFNSVALGKNFYAYWDHDLDEISLHYDLVGVGPTSTLAISNDMADTDSTTFYPFLDGELVLDSAWKVTGILFGYRGAYAYGRNQATIDSLSPSEFSPVNFLRDEVYSTDRVGLASTANVLIGSMLEERSVDIEKITCTIRVPATQVNLVEAGNLISVKFTHLPGYEEATLLPVIRRNVVPTPGRVDMYDIHLELSGQAKPLAPGGGPPEVFPPQNTCDVGDVAVVQSAAAACAQGGVGEIIGATFDDPPVAGNLLIVAWSASSIFNPDRSGVNVGDIDGWTSLGIGVSMIGTGGAGGAVQMFYKIADGTETGAISSDPGTSLWYGDVTDSICYLVEVSGVDSFDTFVENSEGGSHFGVPITPTADHVTFMLSLLTISPAPGSFPITPDAGVTELYHDSSPISGSGNPGHWLGYMIVADTTGSAYDVRGTITGDHDQAFISAAFYCSGGDIICPASGQQNKRPEVVVITVADGTTLCPFADGSLHVFIDNVEQTDTLVSQDGTTGDFTLGFTPTPTEVCTVEYQGR